MQGAAQHVPTCIFSSISVIRAPRRGRLTCSHGTLLGINEEKEKECLVITLLPFFQTNSIALDEASLGRVFIARWRRARLQHLGTVLRDFWRCFQQFNKEAYQTQRALRRLAPVL